MQPLKSEMRVGRKKSKRQVNVVSKLDNLYKLIRRLGLHYKISENFGSTTITIGRNYHGFNELYDHSSSDDSTESKHVPERDDSLTRQEAAKLTLKNMDTLYKFVRGLGLIPSQSFMKSYLHMRALTCQLASQKKKKKDTFLVEDC